VSSSSRESALAVVFRVEAALRAAPIVRRSGLLGT
jgi:hypothetical protein